MFHVTQCSLPGIPLLHKFHSEALIFEVRSDWGIFGVILPQNYFAEIEILLIKNGQKWVALASTSPTKFNVRR